MPDVEKDTDPPESDWLPEPSPAARARASKTRFMRTGGVLKNPLPLVFGLVGLKVGGSTGYLWHEIPGGLLGGVVGFLAMIYFYDFLALLYRLTGPGRGTRK